MEEGEECPEEQEEGWLEVGELLSQQEARSVLPPLFTLKMRKRNSPLSKSPHQLRRFKLKTESNRVQKQLKSQ